MPILENCVPWLQLNAAKQDEISFTRACVVKNMIKIIVISLHGIRVFCQHNCISCMKRFEQVVSLNGMTSVNLPDVVQNNKYLEHKDFHHYIAILNMEIYLYKA